MMDCKYDRQQTQRYQARRANSSSLLTALITSGSEDLIDPPRISSASNSTSSTTAATTNSSLHTPPSSRATTPTPPPADTCMPAQRKPCIKFQCDKVSSILRRRQSQNGKHCVFAGVFAKIGGGAKNTLGAPIVTPPSTLVEHGGLEGAFSQQAKICVDDLLSKDRVFSRLAAEVESEESEGNRSDDERGAFSSDDDADPFDLDSRLHLSFVADEEDAVSEDVAGIEDSQFALDEENSSTSTLHSRILSQRKVTPQDIDPSCPSDRKDQTPKRDTTEYAACKAQRSPRVARCKQMQRKRRCQSSAIDIRKQST